MKKSPQNYFTFEIISFTLLSVINDFTNIQTFYPYVNEA